MPVHECALAVTGVDSVAVLRRSPGGDFQDIGMQGIILSLYGYSPRGKLYQASASRTRLGR
jgi:hypothetical protein